MSDPIRVAAERLLQQLDQRRTGLYVPLLLEQAEDDLRAALAALTPPAGGAAMSDRLPPKIGHVFRLASIICDALEKSDDGSRATTPVNPITLAQRILSHPHSQWAPAQEDKGND